MCSVESLARVQDILQLEKEQISVTSTQLLFLVENKNAIETNTLQSYNRINFLCFRSIRNTKEPMIDSTFRSDATVQQTNKQTVLQLQRIGKIKTLQIIIYKKSLTHKTTTISNLQQKLLP